MAKKGWIVGLGPGALLAIVLGQFADARWVGSGDAVVGLGQHHRDSRLSRAYPSPEALLKHLLSRSLTLAYPKEDDYRHALYWLRWLAYRMSASRDLRWWDIPSWTPYWQRALPPSVMFGTAMGLVFGFGGGPTAGPLTGALTAVSGLIAGAIAGPAFARGSPRASGGGGRPLPRSPTLFWDPLGSPSPSWSSLSSWVGRSPASW
jgi:hypothetical protein